MAVALSSAAAAASTRAKPRKPSNLAAIDGGGERGYEVTFTDTKPPKLKLPRKPAHDDLRGQLAWITSVLRFDPAHPATAVKRAGKPGQDGHVEIQRAGTSSIPFEPASTIDNPRRFLPALRWHLQPTDGAPYGFKGERCNEIADVVRLAAGVCAAPDAAQEAAAIVGTLTFMAEVVEGATTYGTAAQRYEAAEKLRPAIDRHSGRAVGAARYLVDENTGEIVVRVSDLQRAAREHIGSSVPHGWLDARMDQLGWTRASLQGYAVAGRDGRKGPHTRCDVYRGHLPSEPDAEGCVNT